MATVSKVEIKQILKDLGLETVKMNYPRAVVKAYKNYEGKSFYGIRGGSQGPMTMTSAHLNHNAEKANKVFSKLNPLHVNVEIPESARCANDATFVINLGDGNYRALFFKWDRFPTYHGSMDYDPSYETYWYVLTTKDFKVK